MKAVQFDEYGDENVLQGRDVPDPWVTLGQVPVWVRAAGIHPGKAAIRSSQLHHIFPATFPSGEGSDFAGEAVALGEGVSNVNDTRKVSDSSHHLTSPTTCRNRLRHILAFP